MEGSDLEYHAASFWEATMKKHIMTALVIVLAAILYPYEKASAQEKAPIRVAIVGLVHGHAHGLFHMLPDIQSVKLVSIYEPQKDLVEQYSKQYHLEAIPVYNDLEKMLTEQKPDAVLVYSTIVDHRKIIEAAAKHGISSMVAKPRGSITCRCWSTTSRRGRQAVGSCTMKPPKESWATSASLSRTRDIAAPKKLELVRNGCRG